MYRKIALIFIAVFIQSYGVIAQALIVFLLLLVFLILNLKKKPFLLEALNDLETLSVVTSTLTIYCGIFFITNIKSSDVDSLPPSVVGYIVLSENLKLIFFCIILISNLCFITYWAYKMLLEVKNTLIKKFEKLYLCLFLCMDREKLEKQKQKQRIEEENELLREAYFKSINNLKKLYKSGKVVLT